MAVLRAVGVMLLLTSLTAGQEPVSFPTQDGGVIHAHLYGKGEAERGVVLAHGGRFNKESWHKQAEELARAGFRVLAIDFRGYGESKGPGQEDVLSAPLHLDVLAAVRYLRHAGAKSVAVVGGSLGGWAAADAAAQAETGEIESIVLLGAGTGQFPPEQVKGRKLFIITREDAGSGGVVLRLPEIQKQYERTPEPKEMLVLEGSAHAQAMFETEHAQRVMRKIVRFLQEQSP
jgi:pimeloyl-ACP methyl ester carboxylesterase